MHSFPVDAHGLYLRKNLRLDMIGDCLTDVPQRFFGDFLSDGRTVRPDPEIQLALLMLVENCADGNDPSFSSPVDFLNSSVSVSLPRFIPRHPVSVPHHRQMLPHGVCSIPV